MFPEHFVEGLEIARIVEPHSAPHHVLRAIPGFLENGEQVSDRLRGLGLNVACVNFAISHRNLAGNVEPAIGLDRAREWQMLPAHVFDAFNSVALDTHAVCSVTSQSFKICEPENALHVRLSK